MKMSYRFYCRLFLISAGALFSFSPSFASLQDDAVDVIEINVNIDKQGSSFKPSLGGISGEAKKLFSRYLFLGAKQAPLLIAHNEPEKKLFTWSVCKNGKNSTLVFLTRNNTKKTKKIVFTLSGKEPLTPTYRRVYSSDGGKKWRTIAFEPPHDSVTGYFQSMPKPYTIEVPPYSYQSATVRLK
jgi:hypothetical protein